MSKVKDAESPLSRIDTKIYKTLIELEQLRLRLEVVTIQHKSAQEECHELFSQQRMIESDILQKEKNLGDLYREKLNSITKNRRN